MARALQHVCPNGLKAFGQCQHIARLQDEPTSKQSYICKQPSVARQAMHVESCGGSSRIAASRYELKVFTMTAVSQTHPLCWGGDRHQVNVSSDY
jgi:hypothetical protein